MVCKSKQTNSYSQGNRTYINIMNYKSAKPNSAGNYRCYGYGNRVWIAKPVEPTRRLSENTIMLIRDAHGNEDLVEAKDLQFG